MIAALQRRFVVSAMIAVTILLVVVLGAVNLTNYAMTERYGDRLMEVLIETEGAPDRSWRAAGGELPMASRREVLEARYFLLRWNDNGDLLYTDTEHTFAVTPQEAIDYGREALQSNVLAGDLEQFRQDMGSKEVAQKIKFDAALSERVGLEWTPSFYLDGELLDQRNITTSEFMDLLREKIDAKLAELGEE